MYRKPPRELDLYGPYQNQEELGGQLRTVRAPKNAKSTHADTNRGQDVDQNQDFDLKQDGDEDGEGEGEEEAFDVHRLHVAYGPKTGGSPHRGAVQPSEDVREEEGVTFHLL